MSNFFDQSGKNSSEKNSVALRTADANRGQNSGQDLEKNGKQYANNATLKSQHQREYTQVGKQRVPNQQFSHGNDGYDQGNDAGNGNLPAQHGYQNLDQNFGYAHPSSTEPQYGGIGQDQYQQNYSTQGYQQPEQNGYPLSNNSNQNNGYQAQSPYGQDGSSSLAYPSDNPSFLSNSEGYNQNNYGADQSGYSYPAQDQNGYTADGFNQSYGYDEGYANGHQDQDAAYYENEYADGEYEDESEGNSRLGIIIAVLVGAIGIGGSLTYAYQNGMLDPSNFTQASNDQPTLLSADRDPVKYKPEDPGGKTISNGKKLIYSRVDNSSGDNSSGSRLVPRQEEVTGLTLSNPGSSATGSVDSSNTSGPRKVKTLVVRPDGSMVSNNVKRIAPTVTTPQEQPKPRSAPKPSQSQGISLADLMASENKPAAAAPKPSPAENKPAQRQINPVLTQSGSSSEQTESSTIARQGSAQRNVTGIVNTAPPSQRSLQDNTAGIRTAALPRQSTQDIRQPAEEITGNGFAVQVAARREQTQALETFANMQQRYPSLLSRYQPLIQRADLGDKGVWYRLRIGPLGDRASATQLCERLKSAGVKNCFVRPL